MVGINADQGSSLENQHVIGEGYFAAKRLTPASRKSRFLKTAGCAMRCLFCAAAMLAALVALLWLHGTWPYPWNLPDGIPLVLGFSTDMGVEDAVDLLRTRYSVDGNDISVRVMRYEHVFFSELPLRHAIVAENVQAPGLTKRRLEFHFVKNRLMAIIFTPALTDEECRAMLGDDYGKYVVTLSQLIQGRKLIQERKPSPALDDRLCLVVSSVDTSVHSKLLSAAYFDWRFHKD